MRKLLNRLLIKFGFLITKAPQLLADKSLDTSELFPAELTEKVTVGTTVNVPRNDLFDIFSADTNVHKWHHYFEIYMKHFARYRDRPGRCRFRESHSKYLLATTTAQPRPFGTELCRVDAIPRSTARLRASRRNHRWDRLSRDSSISRAHSRSRLDGRFHTLQ